MRFYGNIDEDPMADWPKIHAACEKHGRFVIEVTRYSEAGEMSARQIRWWKGVLMPALAENGESESQWETRLKLNVMPDDFRIETVTMHGFAINCVPSVKILSAKKASLLVEGSVAWLRDETQDHGDLYQWVTLPDPLKRKKA